MSRKSNEASVKRWESAVDSHRTVIAEALQAATAGSVISSVDEVILKTEDGHELKLSTNPRESSISVEVVAGGKTVDATPSAKFAVAGETLIVKEGRLVGGSESASDFRSWALFALMPAGRERSGAS
jgi:hypothetical protein